MTIKEITSYSLSPNILCRKIGEIQMIYNKENGDMYELNDIGSDLLDYLQKQMPMSEILRQLCKEYDVEESVILPDVSQFIIRMIELGVVLIPNQVFNELFSLSYDEHITVDEYLTMRESVGWESLNIKQAQEGLDHSYQIVCCRCNGIIVGCARSMWDMGYTVFIVDVMVKPEWQHRGIGTRLMELLLDTIEKELSSGDKVMINLYASSGKEAFYEKLGFSNGSGMVKWMRK